MTPFEQAVINEVKRIRARLTDTNMNRFEFSIVASGRVNDGDVLIRYELEPDYDRAVKGNSVDGVVKEAMRRFGWDEQNAPKEISFNPESN